ncbi:TPA: hypothetical protein M4K80_000493 [Salmonella enterica]|nr:hypothetical protein [Salmonella enterica]
MSLINPLALTLVSDGDEQGQIGEADLNAACGGPLPVIRIECLLSAWLYLNNSML